MSRGKKRGDPAYKLVGMFAMMIVALCLVPMITDQIQNVDTSCWNFTGALPAKTMLGLIPFIFIIGIIIAFITGLLKD
ncbi:MAG: hypothetical protein QW228_08080 [Candidatus Aenigmatarchaeota archaeon]